MAQLNIFNALLLLQEKNAGYFKSMQANIMNFIEISWSQPIRVNIKNEKMPGQLRRDIEEFLLPLNNAEAPKKNNIG
jgi:hypothetical protein